MKIKGKKVLQTVSNICLIGAVTFSYKKHLERAKHEFNDNLIKREVVTDILYDLKNEYREAEITYKETGSEEMRIKANTYASLFNKIIDKHEKVFVDCFKIYKKIISERLQLL